MPAITTLAAICFSPSRKGGRSFSVSAPATQDAGRGLAIAIVCSFALANISSVAPAISFWELPTATRLFTEQ
jgi:hypothetical protein